jgi:hypothetical protein
MLARIRSKLDELSSEVLLGGEGIAGGAAQREIVYRVLAAPREGTQVGGGDVPTAPARKLGFHFSLLPDLRDCGRSPGTATSGNPAFCK